MRDPENTSRPPLTSRAVTGKRAAPAAGELREPTEAERPNAPRCRAHGCDQPVTVFGDGEFCRAHDQVVARFGGWLDGFASVSAVCFTRDLQTLTEGGAFFGQLGTADNL